MSFIINNRSVNVKDRLARQEIKKEYQEKIKTIVEQIKGNDQVIIKKELIKRLFAWWNNNIQYDNSILNNRRINEGTYSAITYKYKGTILACGEKCAPILLHKGVCNSFSEAFKDICDLIGIECRVVHARDKDVSVESFKRLAHAWNEVTIDGETTTIDLDPHFLTCMGQRRTKPKFEIHSKSLFEINEKE